MWTLAVALFTFEVLRLTNPTMNKMFAIVARPMLRAHETSRLSGTPYYMFGLAVSTTMFSKEIALASFLCLAFLDPVAAAAAYFTRSIEWAKLPNGKSIIGFLASATVCTCVMQLITCRWNTGLSFSLKVGIIAASAELMVPSPQITLPFESFPLGIDDNAVIPIVSGFVISELFKQMNVSATVIPKLCYV